MVTYDTECNYWDQVLYLNNIKLLLDYFCTDVAQLMGFAVCG